MDIRKRNGQPESYECGKIKSAILCAFASVNQEPGEARMDRIMGLVKAHALRAQLMLLHQRPDLLLITDQHRLNQALLMGPHSGQKRMLILRHDYGHPLLSNSRTYGCKIIQ